MNTIRRLLTLILVFVASTVFAQDVDVKKINEQLIEAIKNGDMGQVVYCCNNGADFLQITKARQDAIIGSDAFWNLFGRIDDVQTGIVFNLFFADYYKDDPDNFSIAIESLAKLYFNNGDYANAEPYLIKTLELYKNNRGEKYPDYVNLLFVTAYNYSLIGKFFQAEPLYLHAIRIMEDSNDVIAVH